MRKPMLILLAALAVGIAAAIGVFAYTSSVQARAVAGQQVVDALVVRAPVPAGTTLGDAQQSGLIEQVQVPVTGVPADALRAVDAANAGLIANAEIPAGQILLAQSFGTTAPQLGPLRIPAGRLAMTVQLDDPARVGAFLRPGSRIAVFNTTDPFATAPGVERSTRLLLEDVEVLAVGTATEQESAGAADEAASSALVTVAVSAADAERLVHATQTGSVYLALLNDRGQLAATTGVTDTTLYDGLAPGAAEPTSTASPQPTSQSTN